MLSENLKKIREQKGLGVNELGRRTGLSSSYLSALERGVKTNPSMDFLEKIADALSVTVDRLTGEAASALIGDQLEVIGMTLVELAEKSGVSLHWLENLDTFTPWSEEYEYGYKWISQVAHVIGLPASQLRAALARQEIPSYDGPMGKADEDFADHVEEDSRQYINDNEAIEYLDELHKRPEMKALFQVGRKASKEDIETAITIIEAFKKKSSED